MRVVCVVFVLAWIASCDASVAGPDARVDTGRSETSVADVSTTDLGITDVLRNDVSSTDAHDGTTANACVGAGFECRVCPDGVINTSLSCGADAGGACCVPAPVCQVDGGGSSGWYVANGATRTCEAPCTIGPMPACEQVGTANEGWYAQPHAEGCDGVTGLIALANCG